MEKKIKYEFEKDAIFILTTCKHYESVKVGSFWCEKTCTHIVSCNKKTQTVTCNHPNNKPDKNKNHK